MLFLHVYGMTYMGKNDSQKESADPQVPEKIIVDDETLLENASTEAFKDSGDRSAWHLAEEPETIESRLLIVKRAENPILEAAGPLLKIMTELPAQLSTEHVKPFRLLLEQEVKSFTSLCEQADVKREHIITAQYCLCTALDEAVNATEWGGGGKENVGPWAQDSLLTTFHKENYGGDKFFLLVGRLAAHPHLHLDVLELTYTILSLGFEGRYRRDPNGKRQLEAIRNRLLALITSGRGQIQRDLSPQWKGVSKEQLYSKKVIPIWFFVALAAALVGAQFIWYKYQLVSKSQRIEENILSIGKITLPKMEKTHNILRLKELLKAEIEQGVVAVDEDDQKSIVTFKGDAMFVPGKSSLDAEIIPILSRISTEIGKVQGNIIIEGHSDNAPIRTKQFPNNIVLSEARAESVAEFLRSKGIQKERITTVGKGDVVPVSSNATPEGRAQNRRVSIRVEALGTGNTDAIKNNNEELPSTN